MNTHDQEETTVNQPPSRRADKLPWLKYNPSEIAGEFSALDNEEYGLLHRIIAKLWATPGNRMTHADLVKAFRIKAGSCEEELLRNVIDYALTLDESTGLLRLPLLDEAFADAVQRSKSGKAGATARWNRQTAPPSSGNPSDF